MAGSRRPRELPAAPGVRSRWPRGRARRPLALLIAFYAARARRGPRRGRVGRGAAPRAGGHVGARGDGCRCGASARLRGGRRRCSRTTPKPSPGDGRSPTGDAAADPRAAVLRRAGLARRVPSRLCDDRRDRCQSSCSPTARSRRRRGRAGVRAPRDGARLSRSALIAVGALAPIDAGVTLRLAGADHGADTRRVAPGPAERRAAHGSNVPSPTAARATRARDACHDERRRSRLPRRRAASATPATAVAVGRIVIPQHRSASYVVVKGTEHRRPGERPGRLLAKRTSPGSPARPRSPGTGPRTWRRSATSTSLRPRRPASCWTCPTRTSSTRSSASGWSSPTDVRGRRRRRRLLRASCCQPARRCSAPPRRLHRLWAADPCASTRSARRG